MTATRWFSFPFLMGDKGLVVLSIRGVMFLVIFHMESILIHSIRLE